MSDLERAAVRRLVDQARELGVNVPDRIVDLCTLTISSGARLWAEAHPDEAATGDYLPCCYGVANGDPEQCTCWEPVFDTEQEPPRPVSRPADLTVAPDMCSDCAYRPGSPERRDQWLAEKLLELPATGEAFWCHRGMRRPVRWQHPDGRTVDGSPDDWQPARFGAVPYQADGSPALLCYGWAARAARATNREESQSHG